MQKLNVIAKLNCHL